MIPQFEQLTKEETSLLLKAPVLVSVLASGVVDEQEINPAQKADAIRLAHLKSFTALPELRTYYLEVEKGFRKEFETALKKYYPFSKTSQQELKSELARVSQVIRKLDKQYADAMSLSFERYATHVKKAAHSVFQDFIFPMPIEGLSYNKG